MTDLAGFRRDLAGLMRTAAADRRRAVAGCRTSGEDMKIIALFDRLAEDAQSVDPGVYLAGQRAWGAEPLARGFRRHAALLSQVGVVCWPRSIEEMVVWMSEQVVAERGQDEAPQPPSGERPSEESRSEEPRSSPVAPSPAAGFSRIAAFAAGFGRVAPVLAMWEIRLGWPGRSTAR